MDNQDKPAMVTEDKALEKYTYRPMEKVGSVGTLKALLQAQERSLAAVIPKHLTPDRLFRTLLTAINRTPELLECTQASIVESVGRAAELGLDVSGTLQEAWILPFNNNIGTREKPLWVKQATLMPGYRGLAKLARNSGEIAKLEARVVKEKDVFELEFGSSPRLVFRPYLGGDRGKTVSCYASAKLTSGEEVVDWMTVDDVEKIRKMSKQPNSLMWRDHWDEGARKTVFRRLSKWLPLSAEKSAQFLEALAQADQEFNLDAFAEAVNVTPGAKTQALADRLRDAGEPEDAGQGSGGEDGGAAPYADYEAEHERRGGRHVGERLSAAQVADIKAAVERLGVSLDELEGKYGDYLAEIEVSGMDAKALEADILRAARALAKARKNEEKQLPLGKK